MAYTRKRGSGSRDIGLSSNGKGSANRVTDKTAFAENYDAINWGRKSEPKILTDKDACDCCGEPKQPGEVPFVPVVVKPLAAPHCEEMDNFQIPAPEAPKVREGYRLVEPGEKIEAGDEYWEATTGASGDWEVTSLVGEVVTAANFYFRKL